MLIEATTEIASRITGAIRDAAQATGASFDYLLKTALRESKSRPGAGIVEFHHQAFKQDGKLVAECHRNAFIVMRPK